MPGKNTLRSFPYYKPQYWDEFRTAWLDIKKRFESVDELRAHAAAKLDTGSKRRVMVVEDYSRRRIDDSIRA